MRNEDFYDDADKIFIVGDTIEEAHEYFDGYIQKIGLEDSFYTLKYDGKKVEKEVVILFCSVFQAQ